MHDPGAPGAQQRERPREELRQLRARHAHDLMGRPCRVGERPEQVERGANAQLSAHRDDVARRGVHRRREQEGDARVRQALRQHLRACREADAERFEHVGAAAPARHGPVPVLGHRQPAGRRHDGGGRGDVEAAAAVAARAAQVGGGRRGDGHLDGPVAHRRREADDLVRPLALHREAHEQRGHLRRGRTAVDDLVHGLGGLGRRQVGLAHHFQQRIAKHLSARSVLPRGSCGAGDGPLPSAPTPGGTARPRPARPGGGAP